MDYTWKDVFASVTAIIMGVAAYALYQGYSWPLLGSWRMGSGVVFLLGLGTCIVVGSGTEPKHDAWLTVGSVLGVLAAACGVLGVIFDSSVFFTGLVLATGLLWVMATIHHMSSSVAHHKVA